MDKPFEIVKATVVNYKLDFCCWIAPVRVGLIITGYFNIFIAVLSLVGTANESFPPTIVKVQEMILEDNATKPIPILAYATELGFSSVLLCAIYRKDIILLRVYMYYCIMAVIMSLLVYSIVIAAIDVLVQIAIILSTMFQIYVLLLVRSAIVEIKMEKKNYELPTLVMSSLVQEKETPRNNQDAKNGQTQDVKVNTEVKVNQEVKVEPEAKVTPEVNKSVEKSEVPVLPPKTIQETKEEKKESRVRSLIRKKEEKKSQDVEKAMKTEGSGSVKKDEKQTKLKTVNEHPKE